MIRITVIGAGSFAGAHIKSARQLNDIGRKDVAVETVVNPSGRGLDHLQRRFAGLRIERDLEKVFADQAVDAVIICTPHDTHGELCIAALRAGKHVLVEKPMAPDLATCQAMVRAAEDANRVLLVGQCERYDGQVDALASALAADCFGAVHAVRIDGMQNAVSFLSTDHWMRDGKRGGGVLLGMAVHRLDLARHLFGEVATVQAHIPEPTDGFINGADALVSGSMVFKSGILCDFFFSWLPVRVPWSEGLQVFGDAGTAHAIPSSPSQFGPIQVSLANSDTSRQDGFQDMFSPFCPLRVSNSQPTTNTIANQLAHFVNCCNGVENPRSAGSDNVNTIRLIEGIRESARSGQAVELP